MFDSSKSNETPEYLEEDEVETLKNALRFYLSKSPTDKEKAEKLLELFSRQSMYFFDSKERFWGFTKSSRETLANALNKYGTQNPSDAPIVLCLLAELLRQP